MLVKRSFAFISFLAVILSAVAVPAQRTRGAVAANRPAAASKCSGAWTGSITYTRTQSMSDNKTVERVSGRGRDTRDWQMNYNYAAQVAVVEAPEKNGTSIGKASINHTFSSIEKVDAVEKNSCDRGKTWQDMRGTSTSETKSSASESGVDANVSIGVNSDGTYTVSVALPQIKGKLSGLQSSSFSGQCKPKEGKSTSMPETETTIDGNSLTSDGTDRINEADPNRISGSYSKTWQNVTETITWNLQKCGAPLRITNIAFQDMKVPTWNTWRDISEQTGTIDGNLVKIKVTVLNASGENKTAGLKVKETYKGDKWDGARPDGLLPGGDLSVRLDPGEQKDVEMMWDSSGYAWFDDGRPRLVQRIKAELEENNKKTDEMTKNLRVAPKPVILVHGLWSNWRAWESWQNILTTSHSYDWKAFPVGEKSDKGVMNTGGEFLSSSPTNGIFENAQEVGKYIRYAQQDRNAWHVDIVAHSMGGLISRHYIHHFMPPTEDGRPQVSHLVMLGTPNMGSPCADVMDVAFSMTGATPEAIRQLKPSVVEEFNRTVTNRKGVKFSVLAGNPLPVMCKSVVWNDGVVPVPSAKWRIADNAESSSIHTDLTGTSDFSNFVKPRLAIGPKGDHNPAPPEAPAGGPTGELRRFDPDRLLAAAVLRPGMLPDDFAGAITLASKQSTEIEIPVAPSSNFGITFMADPKVSATLVDDKGAVVGSNKAGSTASRAWFRSIYVDRPVAAGTWRLKLENTGDFEYPVYLTAWSNAVR